MIAPITFLSKSSFSKLLAKRPFLLAKSKKLAKKISKLFSLKFLLLHRHHFPIKKFYAAFQNTENRVKWTFSQGIEP